MALTHISLLDITGACCADITLSEFPNFNTSRLRYIKKMPTEFISLAFPNASTELQPIPGAGVDPEFLARYARNLDDYDYNYTLQPACQNLIERSWTLTDFL